jgi:DNA topoisomerase-1
VAIELGAAELTVASVDEKPFRTRPYPPFMTSTLQQEAGRKLRFNAQRTMRVAQSLYENGYITYMRTDSTTLSQEALQAARRQAARLYGESYLPDKPRVYERKSKAAQEAHEAIRPAGERFRTPSEVKGELDGDQMRLYELIWKRTLASQMRDAEGVRSSVNITAPTPSFGTATLAAAGKVLTFPGFLRAYVEGSDDPGAELADQEKVLPPLSRGQALDAVAMEAAERTTQPPPRHTEATLIKELEGRGIGRPSTYAAIIQTIQDRGYAWHKGPALVPTFTAFAVTQLLERHLSALVDYTFTARMEDELDRIASGELELEPWLYAFYFGDPAGGREDHEISRVGLQAMVADNVEKIVPQEVASIRLGHHLDGDELTVRVGRYGPYVEIGSSGEQRVSVPEDLPPDELTAERVRELLERAINGSRELGRDPSSGKPVYLKSGRFGPYVQLGDAEPAGKGKAKKAAKPKVASLWPEMSAEDLSFEDALHLLSYPRELGTHPETGEIVLAHFGRYGPYVKMGDESRTLDSHDTLRTITLEQAVEILKQPRQQRRRARSEVLNALGTHPSSGVEIQLKDGRFGPYVTDGTVNASVPKGTDPATITLERAVELLAAREDKLRAQGKDPRAPKPKGGRRKGTRRKRS